MRTGFDLERGALDYFSTPRHQNNGVEYVNDSSIDRTPFNDEAFVGKVSELVNHT